MNRKIGVAFAGGGGKGGYQVGVCKALDEFLITPDAVSGTSVGALNGSLYAQRRVHVAEQIWKNIKHADVLDFSVDRFALEMAKAAARRFSVNSPITRLLMAIAQLNFKSRGLFSQDGLLNMMERGFADQSLSSLSLPFWAAVHNIDKNEVDYLTLSNRDENDSRKLLLASAALPGIFGDIELDGSLYSDGGWFWGLPHKKLDNTPVMPLYNAGCDLIILVCLSRDDLIARDRFPNARILPIVPSRDLGGIIDGVMDFSAEGANERIDLGYRDAKQILSKLTQFIGNEEEYERFWQEIAKVEATIAETGERLNATSDDRINIKRKIVDFNNIVANDTFEGELDVELPNETNLLEYANNMLIRQLDRHDMIVLNGKIADYVDQNRDDAVDLQQAAVDAVAFLSPVVPQSSLLTERGFFGRIFHGIQEVSIGKDSQAVFYRRIQRRSGTSRC